MLSALSALSFSASVVCGCHATNATHRYDNPLAEFLGVAMSTLNSAADDATNAVVPIIVVGIGGAYEAWRGVARQ